MRKTGTGRYFTANFDLYLILLPGLLYALIFRVLPMAGVVIAFKDYSLFAGDNIFDSVFKSPWVGLDQFRDVFAARDFLKVLANTLIISLYKIVFLFPVPILLAFMLNEISQVRVKRIYQSIIYMPYFLSWVIVASLFISMLSMYGPVNNGIEIIFGEKIKFFLDNRVFRSLLVITEGWKDSGFNTIIYLAAITAIDPQLYEAAIMDGASRLQRIWHITLPSIASTIVMLFILKLGYVLDAGFTQVFAMYNPTVYDSSDIIDTYVYRLGLGKMEFSFATAVGLFKSLVGFVLILASNTLLNRYSSKSIW